MKTKNFDRIVGLFAAVMLATGVMLLMAYSVAAQSLNDSLTSFVGMGSIAAFVLFIAAIFVWALWSKSNQYGGPAKAIAVVLVVVGFAIWGGVFLVEPATVSDPGTNTPTFALTVNAANNTTVSTAGIAAMTVNLLWDISDDALTGCDDLTMNFTVYRSDQLSSFFYTNARVDTASLTGYTTNEGTTATNIALSSGNYQTTWTDSLGNALTNVAEIPSVPQSETTRETITLGFVWSDAGIRGMVDNSQSVDTFNIVFAESSTDAAGNIKTLTPLTIPITLLVVTQA